MNEFLSVLRPMATALPESGIVKVINYGREKPGVIPFWAGEGDLPTPEFIAEAAIRALREGHTFYTYQRGIPPLRQAIAGYHLAGLAQYLCRHPNAGSCH
jgi:aspartate/methionine/tyrosine aminotransferase